MFNWLMGVAPSAAPEKLGARRGTRSRARLSHPNLTTKLAQSAAIYLSALVTKQNSIKTRSWAPGRNLNNSFRLLENLV